MTHHQLSPSTPWTGHRGRTWSSPQKKSTNLRHHVSQHSGVSQPRHWGDASFNLTHTILVDRPSFFSPLPLTLTDCRSDEMTVDQWRSQPLKWLQVSLQGYPPCLICRRAPVGPRHPLISRSEGKRALLSKSSTATFEWQRGRGIGSRRASRSHNHLGNEIFPVVIIP